MDEAERQAMSQRIKELESQLVALRTVGTDSEVPSTSTGGATAAQAPAPVIYVQQDRKLPRFSGKVDSNNSWTLDEWIEQMRQFAQTRGTTEKERAQIVHDHLEGAARTEIKFLPASQRECMDSIFKVLKEVYGCMHSHIVLQRRFYNHRQLEGESLIDFSHSLMDLITKTDAQAASIAASKDLRDQFCDGVRDQPLKIRLRDLVTVNPNWTIRVARAEATRWMAQCGGLQKVKNDYSLASNETVVACESISDSSQYKELMSLLKAQQSQLDLVIKALAPQSLPPARTRYTRPQRTTDGQPICFRCDQAGHIARNCPSNVKNDRKANGKLEPASVQSQALVGGQQCSINCNVHADSELSHLIGECFEAEVNFAGVSVPCLLDSGSMVTTVTKSYFNNNFSHLSDQGLKDCGWLGLKAANGLEIPYLGYIELDVHILGVSLPCRSVLIVKEPADSLMTQKKTAVPGVLGMNVFNLLYCELLKQHGPDLWEAPVLQSAPPGLRRVLRYCQVMEAMTSSPDPHLVRV